MTNQEILSILSQKYGKTPFYGKQAVREGVLADQPEPRLEAIVGACEEAKKQGIVKIDRQGNWVFVKEV